jgi:hypothetical protein
MRSFLGAVLILGGLGLAGYAVWLLVQARGGASNCDGLRRPRTFAIAAAVALLLGGTVTPSKDSGNTPNEATTTATAPVVADTSDAVDTTTTSTVATTAADAVAEQAAHRREDARAALVAKRTRQRAAKRRVARAHARRAARVLARARIVTAAREAAEAAPPTTDPSQYAGMNCTEIGHSFDVTPGSDPVHDRDNDGVACESQ